MNFGEMKSLFLRLMQEAGYSQYYDNVFAGQLINQGKDDIEGKFPLYIADSDGDVNSYYDRNVIKGDYVFYNRYSFPNVIIKPLYCYLDNGTTLKQLTQIDDSLALRLLNDGQDISGYYSIQNNYLLIYNPPTNNPVWRLKYVSIEDDFVNDSDEPNIPKHLHKAIVYSACFIGLGTENERNSMIENLYRIELMKIQEYVNNTNLYKEYFLTEDGLENYIENF